MPKIAKNLSELIGNTPIPELAGYARKHGLTVAPLAKLEFFNPAGSVKDRGAGAMFKE